MKKLFPVVLAVLLMFCFSIPSFAYYTGTIPGLTREGDDVRIKTIITSTLTEPQKDFMRLWFAGGGSGKTLLHYDFTNMQPALYFSIVPANTSLKRDSSINGKFLYVLPDSSSPLVSLMAFKFDDSSQTYKFSIFLPNRESVILPTARLCGSFNSPLLDPEYQLNYDGDCLIDDDGGLAEKPESSSSESSSSEAPKPPYVPAPTPSMPSGGSDSPYIPYDPDVWWEAVSFIRSGAGAAANILFLILAPFVLVSLALFFIRHYASGGKGGGGGTSI